MSDEISQLPHTLKEYIDAIVSRAQKIEAVLGNREDIEKCDKLVGELYHVLVEVNPLHEEALEKYRKIHGDQPDFKALKDFVRDQLNGVTPEAIRTDASVDEFEGVNSGSNDAFGDLEFKDFEALQEALENLGQGGYLRGNTKIAAGKILTYIEELYNEVTQSHKDDEIHQK